MQKKQIFMSVLVVMAFTTLASGAMARGTTNGYEPLYWNGPAGYGDYNILFTGPEESRFLSFGANNRGRRASRKCSSYKNRYLRTGKKVWLRKYRICRVDY